jgi:hypothetical protein
MTTPPPLNFSDHACVCVEAFNVLDAGLPGRSERKRAWEEPGLESAEVCLESAEHTAVPGNMRRGTVKVTGGIHPRRNWARRLSRMETPASVTCHVRHSWLLRRLLSNSCAALGLSSLNPGASAIPPATRNFAEYLKTEGRGTAPKEERDTRGERLQCSVGRVDTSGERLNARRVRLNTPVDEWLESSTVDISGGGGSSARLMWPTPLEDSSAWTAWAGEESCLPDTGSNLVVEPSMPNAAEAEPIVEPPAEEVLMSCPAQFLVSLPEDGSG